MPESKSRKKPVGVPRPETKAAPQGNPRWLVPTMITLFVVGLLWVVTTYVSQTRYPIPGIANWNLAIGFAMLLGGMGLAMRWR